MGEWTPPDQAARDRILRDLDTNLLVEAGAGSGKTTAMVGRMVQLIRTGKAEVDQIAAVTFTRKAAAELRERFQERLEAEYRAGSEAADDEARARIRTALHDLERCFTGTIHSFCARLLRERPLEAGVPSSFQEFSDTDEERFRADCWNGFLERLARRDSRLVSRLAELGLEPRQLVGVFHELSDNPDVEFRAERVPAPEPCAVERVRSDVGALLDRSLALLPDAQPEKGWDKLQSKLRSLRFSRRFPGWDEDVDFLDALADAVLGSNSLTQKRWAAEKAGKRAAKAVGCEWDDFAAENGRAHRLLMRWFAHRYPTVLRFARAAASHYERERLRAGRLTFADLLTRSAALLRGDATARRELGERYRYVLVDEFQDTDPIQAEVLLLLASDAASGTAWWRARPRPGALFVVGDPKQSIYRFRRADIAVYNQVASRFREFGDVVELTANFRSTRPIGEFVNRAFSELLPAEATERQAEFAEMRTRPEEADGEGVRWYRFPPVKRRGGFSGGRVSEPDSALLASWIRRRIDDGEREAGEIMVLTRTKSQLSRYARELEARNIPVEVSGAGVGADREIGELILLLRALNDPANPVLTLAVLEGLFFGLDHDALYTHVRDGGAFDFRASNPAGSAPVTNALERLRGFWRQTRTRPADIAVPTIASRVGILPYAAAGELGNTRAGALLYALDVLRTVGLDGRTALVDAIDALETTMDDDVDAPLLPGETNAVRLMNLHKAKGLEAPVVVLAYPAKPTDHAPTRYFERRSDGTARGHVLVEDSTRRPGRPVARPLDWDELEASESAFRDAEETRLLYVAATRAAEELVVARCTRTDSGSYWDALHSALDDPDLASERALERRSPPEREQLRQSAAAIRERISAARDMRRGLGRVSYRAAPVTDRIAEADSSRSAATAGRGKAWGTAVHRALEAAGHGVDEGGLRDVCADALRAADCPTDAAGVPAWVNDLVATVERVTASTLWSRARSADRIFYEAPFAVSFTGEEWERLRGELGLPAHRPDACVDGDAALADAAADAGREPLQVVDGTVDLAFRENGGWVIVDYKTDIASAEDAPKARLRKYRRQVDLYAACWQRIAGEPVLERHLHFPASGTGEIW